MKGYLLGSTTVGGKAYTYNDIDGIVSTGFGSDYYGGRVKAFGQTKEGFLLCIEKDKVIDIFVDEDILTNDGLKMLIGKEPEQVEQKEPEAEQPKSKQEERKELLAKAKELGVEGKIATMKNEELKELVQEKLKG